MPNTERFYFLRDSQGDLDFSQVACRDCSSRTTLVMVAAGERDAHEVFHKADRHAVVRGQHDRLNEIRRYLPSNFIADSDGVDVYVHGFDSMGWTLTDYVLPRLASGMYYGAEILPCAHCGQDVTASHPTLSSGSAYRIGEPLGSQFPPCSNPAGTGHEVTL